jgi:hypothetical protein
VAASRDLQGGARRRHSRKLRKLQFVRFDTGPGVMRPLSRLADALRNKAIAPYGSLVDKLNRTTNISQWADTPAACALLGW